MVDVAGGTNQENEGRICNLLLADDDETNRDIFRHFLSGIGTLELTEVTEGRAALSLCLTRCFDLLILDFRLPFIGGDRIARHLRGSSNPNSATPIILSTAMSQDEIGKELVNCPYDRFLPKPFSRDDLVGVVSKELGLDLG